MALRPIRTKRSSLPSSPSPPSDEPNPLISHRPPKKQQQMSVYKVLASTNNLTHVQISKAKEYAHMFKEEIRSYHNYDEVWSETFKLSDDKTDDQLKRDPLYIFRDNLSRFITKYICTKPVKCESFGSTNASSDIDVTIDGGLEYIQRSLNTYIRILKFLDIVFYNQVGRSRFFPTRSDIFHFFDMNFYLSNFALKRGGRQNYRFDKYLSSYYLSNMYGPEFKDKNQFRYAVINIMLHNQQELKKPETLLQNKYLNDVEKLTTTRDPNEIVDILSRISTLEDECYHTQGAFFHVVLILQRKIEFVDISEYKDLFINMMRASALENLAFAYTHSHAPKKMLKYVMRYHDAIRRIEDIDSDAVFPLVPISIPDEIDASFITKTFRELQRLIRVFVNPTSSRTAVSTLRR